MRLARAALVHGNLFPYYYPIVFGLTLVETEEVPTMAVDNRLRLYYNPRWVEGLSDPELLGVVWHECHHVLRGHVHERGEALQRFALGAVLEGLQGEEAVKRLQEVWRERLIQGAPPPRGSPWRRSSSRTWPTPWPTRPWTWR